MLGRAIARYRWTALAVLVVTARASAGPEASSDSTATDAEVFERVFKGHRGATRAPVVLVVDGVAGATILIELQGTDGSPEAPSAPVLAAVGARLSAEAARRVVAAVRDLRVSVAALRTAGLEVVYDSHKLQLRIVIPPDLTKQASHDLGTGAPLEAAGALRPSDASGYLNVRAGFGGSWIAGDGVATPSPAHVNTDGALNLRGWVLEGRADLARSTSLDGAPLVVHRGDVLLSHDVPAHALRYLAGDLAVPFAGLQPSFPVLGLGVIRNFGLQPYRVVQPVGAFDFVLDTQSSVTVLVNGAPVQTLTLPAGRHDIRDLPLAAGVNDVELVIRNASGVERRVSFSTATPNELLAPGIVQFSLTLGFPLISDVDLRTYDFSRPILSGRRRWGVTPNVTVGGSFDSSVERHRAGSELATATMLGNVALDASASCDNRSGCGHAESVGYSYTHGAQGTANAFAVVGRRFSPGFLDLGVEPINHYRDEVAVSLTRALPGRLVGRVSLREQRGRDWPDASEASLAFARSFGGLGMTATLTTRDDGLTEPETRIFVTAQWVLPDRRSSIHAVSRASTAVGVSNELTYTSGAGPPPGGLVSSMTVMQAAGTVGAAGALGYTGDRFISTVALDTIADRHGVAQTAMVEVSTAIAFAGDRFAWSRPITGSFALIARNHVLDDVLVEVNPALGGHGAEADGFGPAVVPNLDAYRVGAITVASPALPSGASLGAARYVVLPTYKSGTLIHVGDEGTVFLRGTLVDSEGKPLAFVVGEAISLAHHERLPIPVMTNRAGRFSMMGLTPGRYSIRIADFSSVSVEIPVGFSGVFSVGTVTMPSRHASPS